MLVTGGYSRLRCQHRPLHELLLCLLALIFFSGTAAQAANPPQANAAVNAASFTAAIAPGCLISIFGTDLDASTELAQGLPLPAQFSGVTVTLNGRTLPLLYASALQINAQLPFDVSGSATLQVTTPAGSSSLAITISGVAPGVFTSPTSNGTVAAIVHANGALVSANAPAQGGEYISIYMTGLGQVNGPISAGQPGPLSPLLSAMAAVQVQIGSAAPVGASYAGLAPGFAGLYQVNVRVPQLAAGSYPLTVLAGASTSNAVTLPVAALVAHYEYVFPDGAMYVYDMDNGFNLIKQVNIPQAQAIRGVAVSAPAHTLYISYGGDGGGANGSMLAYDLLSDQVVWTVNYSTGIDSMAITPDGKTIYMPTGELNLGTIWNVIDASNGNVTGTIAAGAQPHNTVVSVDGTAVYMGPKGDNFLYAASTATNTITHKIGPLVAGVRPFTINGKQTLAFTTATGFLGFQVSDINAGQVLYTVPIAGFSVPSSFPASIPSHGISLSPDEREIWVMDAANSYVHVFDVTGLPGSAPRQVADLPLTRPMTSLESPCNYDCLRDGWVQHSRDGRFVFIGDSGDVFDTATRKSVINLDPLYNTRKHLEIDWQNGVPVFSTGRQGLGYVTP